MKITITAIFGVVAVWVFVAPSPEAHAQQSCITLGPRTDMGSSGMHVSNSCDKPVTLVVFGNGTDYITMEPGSSINWTTGIFNTWKACWGKANTSC
jgi:hypothetical protein